MDGMRLPGSVRRPGSVPDDIAGGADTDGDGVPDTVLTADGVDLLVQTDLDADGLVDRVLRIGPDGAVRAEPLPGEEDDPVVGSVRDGWTGLFDGLLGPDP
jgi:hypothetical protein